MLQPVRPSVGAGPSAHEAHIRSEMLLRLVTFSIPLLRSLCEGRFGKRSGIAPPVFRECSPCRPFCYAIGALTEDAIRIR